MTLPPLSVELTLDPKGRVSLPRDLRAYLDLKGINKLVAFANSGPGGGMSLTLPDAYEALAAEHLSKGPLHPAARLFSVAIAATAHRVGVDSAGRVLIPPALRTLLGLERELRLFTSRDWIEIWDRDRWADQAYAEASAVWNDLYGFGSLKRPAAGSAGGDGA